MNVDLKQLDANLSATLVHDADEEIESDSGQQFSPRVDTNLDFAQNGEGFELSYTDYIKNVNVCCIVMFITPKRLHYAAPCLSVVIAWTQNTRDLSLQILVLMNLLNCL